MKKKAKRALAKARSVGRSLASGAKGTALQMAVGALAGYGRQFVDGKVSALGSRPWATPLIVGLVGHIAKKRAKFAAVGPALCGASGAMLGQYFRDRQSGATPAQLPAGQQTQGFGDAGLVYSMPAPQQVPQTLEAPPVVVDEPVSSSDDAGIVYDLYSVRAS